MNFKPNLLKSIISFISGIITNFLLAGTTRIQCMLIEGGTCTQPTWIEHAFDPVPVAVSLFVIILVYTVWSLIQKK